MEVVDVQFLAGVAATVFLALVFFGVVVLWDVALALRSVGDKIDKLEDNVDDDLKDIGHSIDGISRQPGGATQLHLGSGGTISSPPPSGGQSPHGEQPASHAQAGAQTPPDQGAQTRAGARSPSMGPEGTAHADSSDADPVGPETTGDAATAHSTPEPDEQAGSAPDDPSEAPSGAEEDAGEDDAATSAEPATDEETPEEPAPDDGRDHPRADRSRGRFITSPDRTPWYAVTIDREAVAAGPPIAGELEAGALAVDDERESDREHEAEPIVIGPGSGSEVESKPEPEPESDPIVVGPAPEDSSDGDEAVADATDEDESADATDEEDVAGMADQDDGATVKTGLEAGSGETPTDAVEADASTASTDAAGAVDDDPADVAGIDDGADDQVEIALGESREGGDLESNEADDSALEASDGDESVAEESSDDQESSEASAQADDPGALEELDFDAFGETDPDLTVDEAVDEMNEDAPATELSGHGFDVTAESDDEGAVLLFELDPDTVDVSGSTRRLLRYQLRSFADRESTPPGDVSIDGNVIVVDIPDADGSAISTWGEATVAIIDRTLYLSDSSS